MEPSKTIRLYHLLSAEHALSNISFKRLKLATYKDLNDPFELLSANLADKRIRYAVTSMKNNEFSKLGILCFSRGWGSPVLWSHYADKHKGIALGFDIPIELTSPVIYSPTRLDIDLTAFEEKDAGVMVHTKFEHWAYEDEVRMHFSLDEGYKERHKEVELYFYNFDASLVLREVILGHSCTLSIDYIRKLVKPFTPFVKVTKARLAFSTFNVVEDKRFKSYQSKI